MLLDDPLADRQADTGPWIALLAVKTVERLEDPLGLRRVHADPIVRDREDGNATLDLGVDEHDRDVVAELERIADQVQEDLAQLARVAEDRGQLLDLDLTVGLLDRPGQHLERLVGQRGHVDALVQQLTAARARVLEKVADERAGLDGCGGDAVDQLLPAVQIAGVALLEQLCVHRDRRQRRELQQRLLQR